MRILSAAAILLAAALLPIAASAAETGQWLDLFDGETLFGWNALGDAAWSVEDGELVCASGSGGMLATTTQFKDFEFTAEVRLKAECSAGIAFRAGLEGHPDENGSSVLWLKERRDGESPWRKISVVAKGGDITVTVDGESVEHTSGSRDIGHIALLYHHNGRARLAARNIRLRPLGLTSIFNGKDLDGWSLSQQRDAQFEVKKGAIRVSGLNGQIETVPTYKNVLLQLDARSNGEHYNSGVFVRGPVDVFWKGYESQVRNQFVRDDRTRPVDYGTGGNYGNQATRKVIPKDFEWFTKTIVINGNHMAVWVNGYLASDFLDTRPVQRNQNAKEGYVPGPGTIHLQGHNPPEGDSTDLAFRNIFVQTYDE